MAVKSLDPKKVNMIFGMAQIGGFADGTYVEIDSETDLWTTVTGADGEVVRMKSQNNKGRITITLLQTSLSNAIFQANVILDQASGAGIVPVSVTESGTLNACFGAEAWIAKDPDPSYSKDVETRTWVIDVAHLTKVTMGV